MRSSRQRRRSCQQRPPCSPCTDSLRTGPFGRVWSLGKQLHPRRSAALAFNKQVGRRPARRWRGSHPPPRHCSKPLLRRRSGYEVGPGGELGPFWTPKWDLEGNLAQTCNRQGTKLIIGWRGNQGLQGVGAGCRGSLLLSFLEVHPKCLKSPTPSLIATPRPSASIKYAPAGAGRSDIRTAGIWGTCTGKEVR